MNSVMQVLVGIKELRKYFFEKEFRNITYATHFP
jgi:ubiquitin C-terminal hydrolase